ncbi:MAG: DUF4405 domain-containing protein [Desulfobacterales bacterium]|nr:DUF4405 domain-containing protein [Desulfobacterales bacterium]
MKIRRITSLTASLAFLLMVLTSVILYIVPQGRVAYWADWHLWGLTKTDWGNIHINMGLLFLIALAVHIYYNWKPLISYLKNKAKQVKVFTPEFSSALVIIIGFIVGTYLLVPPFSWVMSLNDHFKDTGAEKYGEPPYGHAELSSLQTFTHKLNLDLAKSIELLNRAGYDVENGEITLEKIGRRYNIPPQLIYETIKPATKISALTAEGNSGLPESPQPGTGNLTIADFCGQFNLNMKFVVRELKKQGIEASEKLTLKEIAADHHTSPTDLYERIKNIVETSK